MKGIIYAAFGIVFVALTIMATVGGYQAGSAYLKTYIMGVEDCRWVPVESKVEPGFRINNEEVCEVNTNEAKKDIAEGLVLLFLAGIPAKVIGFIGYRQLKKKEV